MQVSTKAMVALLIGCATGTALGSINSVTISGGALGDRIALDSIGMQRGADPFVYDYGDLLIPSLDAINVPSATSRTLLLYADPLDSARDQALSDPYINTGFLDPGTGSGNFGAGAEFVKLAFDTPVRNDAGTDFVVFYIGIKSSGGLSGLRPFHMSFNGATSYSVGRDEDFPLFSIDVIPYYAFPGGVTTPGELVSETPQQTGSLGNPTASIFSTPLILEFDLSNFGIASGATIDTLYLQDDSSDSRDFYPTLVAGLPAIPEPATVLLFVVGGVAALRRHRQRKA